MLRFCTAYTRSVGRLTTPCTSAKCPQPPSRAVGSASRAGVRPGMGAALATPATAEAPVEAASTEADAEWAAFQAHQRDAAQLPHAAEARTLFSLARTGVLSTLGSAGDWRGFPVGTVVEFTLLESGEPVFAFSSLSSHTPDVRADPRVSLTVTAPGFQGMADARAVLAGELEELREPGAAAAASAAFKAQHPDSFWVDFGDFAWFKLSRVVSARLVGGFGRIRQISPEGWFGAEADPVAAFSRPIAAHMNADHADSLVAMTKHAAGITVDSAQLKALDSLGMDLQCSKDGQAFSCRLPFSRPARDRKAVKDVIVEMTRAAAAAAKA